MENTCITNARVILPDRIVPQSTVIVQGKKIVSISQHKGAPRGAFKINAGGNFVAPGFIDLHIHGDIQRISLEQAKGGTSAFLATLHPQSPKALLKDINQVLKQKDNLCGARLLGISLEGPFLQPKFCGALPPRLLRPPDIKEIKTIIRKAGRALKVVIIAPELKGALKAIRIFKKNKVVGSLGHSGASYEQAKKGIAAGITHATHTFNRMSGFDRRAPGAIGAVLTDGRVACEVIADGIHVHPAGLKLLLACKGIDKMMLVTDSTAAQQHPDKRRHGPVFILKDGTLYGTALRLNQALRNIIHFLGLNLQDALKLVTLNPARVLKIDKRKGTLAAGKDADIVIFDKNLNVRMTIVEGRIVYVWNSWLHRQS